MKNIKYISLLLFLFTSVCFAQTPAPKGTWFNGATKSDTLSGSTRVPLFDSNKILNKYTTVDSLKVLMDGGEPLFIDWNYNFDSIPETATKKILTQAERDLIGSAVQPEDLQDIKVVQNEYANMAAAYANQANQTSTFIQYVLDASAFPNTPAITGARYFEYLGTTNGNATDYRLLSDVESGYVSTTISNLPYNAALWNGDLEGASKNAINGALLLKAPLNSPAFTGAPTAPTAASSSNTTQVANTAWVRLYASTHLRFLSQISGSNYIWDIPRSTGVGYSSFAWNDFSGLQGKPSDFVTNTNAFNNVIRTYQLDLSNNQRMSEMYDWNGNRYVYFHKDDTNENSGWIITNNLKLGNTTATSLVASGNLTANSFIKTGGTSSEYLMADGSVSTSGGGSGAVSSVNSQTGAVVLDADDISDTSTTNKFVTSTEKGLIATALQPSAISNEYYNAGTWATADTVAPSKSAINNLLLNSVVLTSGNQSISGNKIFNSYIGLSATSGITFTGNYIGNANSGPSITRKSNKMAFLFNSGNSAGQPYAVFDGSLISGTDKTFTFPNKSGTIALLDDITSGGGVDTEFKTITYSSTINQAFDKEEPNAKITLTGDLDFTYTGTVNGDAGILVIYDALGNDITLNGVEDLVITNSSDDTLYFTYINTGSGIEWFRNYKDVSSSSGFDPSSNQTISGDWEFEGTTVLPSTFNIGTSTLTRVGNHNLTFTTDADGLDMEFNRSGYVAVQNPSNTQLFSGVNTFDQLRIRTETPNVDYVITKSALSTSRDILLPALTTDDEFVFKDHAVTLTNKTINLSNNTLTGTKAQFDTALSDDNFAYQSDIANIVESKVSGEPEGANVILNIVFISQNDYDAAELADELISTTLYIIKNP